MGVHRRRILQAAATGLVAGVSDVAVSSASAAAGVESLPSIPAGRTHVLESTKDTVSMGVLDPSRPPAVTIDSGDIVHYPDTWTGGATRPNTACRSTSGSRSESAIRPGRIRTSVQLRCAAPNRVTYWRSAGSSFVRSIGAGIHFRSASAHCRTILTNPTCIIFALTPSAASPRSLTA